jgi:hypothetical protein
LTSDLSLEYGVTISRTIMTEEQWKEGELRSPSRQTGDNLMQCPNGCFTPMKTRFVKRIFYRRKEPIVIRDLEINVCEECGMESLPLRSAQMVERILSGQVEPVGEFVAPLFEPVAA